MIPVLGQQAVLRWETSRHLQAVVTAIVSGDTVELLVFADGDTWGDGYTSFQLPCRIIDDVQFGTGVGQWQPGTLLDDRISQIPAIDTTSIMFVTDDGSAPSLVSGVPRKPNDFRPVFVEVSAAFTWNLTAIGTQTGSIVIKNDDQETPTTVTHTFPFSRGIGVGVTVGDTGTMPFYFGFWVRPGNFYSVTAIGNVTFSIHENIM